MLCLMLCLLQTLMGHSLDVVDLNICSLDHLNVINNSATFCLLCHVLEKS